MNEAGRGRPAHATTKLQHKSQDIVNAMDGVATTKKLIQDLREHGWDKLISDVTSL